MSFYHLIVETKEKNKKGDFINIFELDLQDIEKIKQEVIKPYVNKDEIFVSGSYISNKEIRSLKIKKTEQKSSVIAKKANEEIPPNIFVFLSKEDVIIGDGNSENITRELIESVKKQESNHGFTATSNGGTIASRQKVFIVHGHDEAIKQEVCRFIEKLDFEAIVLHEQSSSGKTVIEKFEHYSSVEFAVILFTPDDIGGHEGTPHDQLEKRARQNVIFELGYFIGKLGRGRTCVLHRDVVIPSDINGVIYISLDSGQWKINLAKEMKAANLEFDFNRVF